MGKWSKDECRRRDLALRFTNGDNGDVSEVVRTRSKNQCKSHLQKVKQHFIQLEKARGPSEGEMTLRNSYLLYLSFQQCYSGSHDMPKVATAREINPVKEEVFTHQDAFMLGMEFQEDFCSFEPTPTTSQTSSVVLRPKK